MTQAGQPPRTRTSSPVDEADRAVLVRLADGELAALEELYDRYKTMAYSIAYRITNDPSLAEDVVQDAFLGVWRNAGRYIVGRGSVKTWLLAIVHHRAIDAVRRRRPTTELPDVELPPPSALTLPDVWAEVVAVLDADTVRVALGALSDVQREAIELAYFGGLTQQEIAERTATPLGTVKSRMRLGLLAMRRTLDGGIDMTGPGPIQDMTCDEIRDVAGAFVLGALPPAEADAVRSHLDSCEDAHAEIRELGGVLPVLNESVPLVEPAAGLKSRIMTAAAADLAARQGEEAGVAPAVAVSATTAAPAATAEPTPFPTEAERDARRSRTSVGTWVLRIAAVLAIVLLGGWNLLLQGQLNAANTYEQSVAAVLDVASQPGSTTAILTTAGGTGGSGLAAISSSGQVTMAMQDLAPTTGSTVYTAWVIAGDGVPVPLGDFTVGNSGTGSLEASGAPSTPGVVLALTLEPQAGAKTPTLPIISKGVATGAG